MNFRWNALAVDRGFSDPRMVARGYFAVFDAATVVTSLLAVGLTKVLPIVLQIFLISALMLSYVSSVGKSQDGNAEPAKTMPRTAKNVASVVEELGKEEAEAPAAVVPETDLKLDADEAAGSPKEK